MNARMHHYRAGPCWVRVVSICGAVCLRNLTFYLRVLGLESVEQFVALILHGHLSGDGGLSLIICDGVAEVHVADNRQFLVSDCRLGRGFAHVSMFTL